MVDSMSFSYPSEDLRLAETRFAGFCLPVSMVPSLGDTPSDFSRTLARWKSRESKICPISLSSPVALSFVTETASTGTLSGGACAPWETLANRSFSPGQDAPLNGYALRHGRPA
jgi:hypothetical protein